jgi:hypothetical protein
MKKILLFLLFVSFLSGTAALADTYNLTCTSTSNCGSTSYGTITVVQGTGAQANSVIVTLTLTGSVFANTGAGESLAFNLTQNSGISITNITSGFAVGPLNSSDSPFGTFMYSVSCITSTSPTGPGCGHGTSPYTNPGPLQFTVSWSGGTLTPSMFTTNAGGFYFASDLGLLNPNGTVALTQNVASNGTPVPEPASMALLGTGLVFVGALRKRFHL